MHAVCRRCMPSRATCLPNTLKAPSFTSTGSSPTYILPLKNGPTNGVFLGALIVASKVSMFHLAGPPQTHTCYTSIWMTRCSRTRTGLYVCSSLPPEQHRKPRPPEPPHVRNAARGIHHPGRFVECLRLCMGIGRGHSPVSSRTLAIHRWQPNCPPPRGWCSYMTQHVCLQT
jgi:hypothetical protein